MKDMPKLILVLTVICLACSAVLAYVYGITKDPIARALEQKTIRAAAAVLPEGCGAPRKCSLDGLTYFLAEKGGMPAAIAVDGVSSNGYGGEIVLMVGLGMDGKLVDFEVVKAAETPGLGMKLGDEEFRGQLRGRPLSGKWKVKKDGGEIEAITAATITSRAVMDCIDDAVRKYRKISIERYVNAE